MWQQSWSVQATKTKRFLQNGCITKHIALDNYALKKINMHLMVTSKELSVEQSIQNTTQRNAWWGCCVKCFVGWLFASLGGSYWSHKATTV